MPKTSQSISVVIPAYNEELRLTQCLESLKNQSRPADEIIVIDNNSRDRTSDIAKQAHVRLIQESQQGIWPAAAAGYDAAKGSIIVRCDADCILPPTWLETIENYFEADPALQAVTGPGNFYDTSYFLQWIARYAYMSAYFLLVGCALAHKPLFGSNMAFRKQAWLTARPHVHLDRTDIHDDIDLSYHVQGSIRYAKELQVGISIRPLTNIRSLPRRYARGFQSLFIHWPEQSPWIRWNKKLKKL